MAIDRMREKKSDTRKQMYGLIYAVSIEQQQQQASPILGSIRVLCIEHATEVRMWKVGFAGLPSPLHIVLDGRVQHGLAACGW